MKNILNKLFSKKFKPRSFDELVEKYSSRLVVCDKSSSEVQKLIAKKIDLKQIEISQLDLANKTFLSNVTFQYNYEFDVYCVTENSKSEWYYKNYEYNNDAVKAYIFIVHNISNNIIKSTSQILDLELSIELGISAKDLKSKNALTMYLNKIHMYEWIKSNKT